ncbi:MAG TPA: hypothetical protein VKQ72_19165 [Aggregatilineales bacterium]|nr:hypothetical protein [Aggregatilineales bacterium]
MNAPYQQGYAPPPRRRFDRWTIALIVAVGAASAACLLAICVIGILVLPNPPTPATPRATLDLTSIFATAAQSGQTPQVIQPTLDSSKIGQVINPYLAANLAGMTMIQVDTLEPATGNYTRQAQVIGSDLTVFAKSFNISVQTVAPNTDCPDHVRLTITRADNSIVTIGVCLKGVVILRGLPQLGGADAPMGPFFSDTLSQYLPDALKKLLNF